MTPSDHTCSVPRHLSSTDPAAAGEAPYFTPPICSHDLSSRRVQPLMGTQNGQTKLNPETSRIGLVNALRGCSFHTSGAR